MPITYPLTFPAVNGEAFARVAFDLDLVQVDSRSRGGLSQAVDRAVPLWRATLDIRALVDEDDREAMRSFLIALKGRIGTFRLHDVTRARPRAYPGSGWTSFTRHGGGAFDGTASVTAVSGDDVTINTLPSTYQVKAGDMISWVWGSTRTLHRAVADATASAGAVTFPVQPRPEALPSGTYPRTVKMEAADAVFGLVSDPPAVTIAGGIGQPFQLVARQRLAP